MSYLKKLLEERNMTQKELAIRSGVSASSIYKYIRGCNSMTCYTAGNLAMALGVDLGEFVKGILNNE